MARRSDNPLESMPPAMWQVLEKAKQRQGSTLVLPAKNVAVNFRHRFHQFRKLMLKTGLADASALMDVTCTLRERPDGKAELEFIYVDLGGVEEAQASAAMSTPLTPDTSELTPTQQGPVMDAEQLVEKMYSLKPSGKQAECEHEFIEHICYKCGVVEP